MPLIHNTLVVDPSFLDVGIRVETHSEPLGEKFILYSQIITWFGADPNIQAKGERHYLSGTYEGFEQTMRIELTQDMLKDVSEKYHDIFVEVATELKQQLKLQFFAAIAEHL